jgi:hypothetical protein
VLWKSGGCYAGNEYVSVINAGVPLLRMRPGDILMSINQASSSGMRFVSRTNPQMRSGADNRLYYTAFAETELACIA